MKRIWLLATFFVAFCNQAIAAEQGKHAEDKNRIFHNFILENEIGKARDGNERGVNLNGWIGGDINRLWVKGEKKIFGDYDKKGELEGLYGRNIAQFWDAQIGIRHDFESDYSKESINYLALGFHGLSPYLFETEAHVFLSDDGDYSARLRQEFDILFSQKFIMQPYLEANFFAQHVKELEVRSGLSELEFGAMTRYEINKKFAPYFVVRYNCKAFGTRELARDNHERVDDFVYAFGLRVRFN